MIKEFINLLKNVGEPFNSTLGMDMENVTVFSGERVKIAGYYGIIKHEKNCDKILPSERHMWFMKGEKAYKPIVCQHDVLWKLLSAS